MEHQHMLSRKKHVLKDHGNLERNLLKRNDAKDWEEIKKAAKENRLDDVPADVYIKHYNTLKAIAKDHLKPVRRTTPRQCYWYYGPTGTGKSRKANDCEEVPY